MDTPYCWVCRMTSLCDALSPCHVLLFVARMRVLACAVTVTATAMAMLAPTGEAVAPYQSVSRVMPLDWLHVGKGPIDAKPSYAAAHWVRFGSPSRQATAKRGGGGRRAAMHCSPGSSRKSMHTCIHRCTCLPLDMLRVVDSGGLSFVHLPSLTLPGATGGRGRAGKGLGDFGL